MVAARPAAMTAKAAIAVNQLPGADFLVTKIRLVCGGEVVKHLDQRPKW
jgi:hypothetical protein